MNHLDREGRMTTAARETSLGDVAALLHAAQLLVSSRADTVGALREVVEILSRVTGADSVVLRPALPGAVPVIEALRGSTASRGEGSPDDTAPVRLTLPLRYGDDVVGSLALVSTGPLAVAHEQCAAVVADMLALACANLTLRARLSSASVDRRRLVAHFIEEAERDRAELAGALHDGALQSLVAARYVADIAGIAVHDGSLDDARRGVQDGLVDARRALWQIRPHAADGQDLAGALDALGRQLAESIGLRVELMVDGLPLTLRPVVASSAFRLVQEMLRTSVRDRAATSATVTADVAGEMLVVTVTDDGVGQLVEVPPGLARWREWVTLLGGDVRLRGKRGGGAYLRARVPMTDGGPEEVVQQ
jgi:signal transduction histidine kinase